MNNSAIFAFDIETVPDTEGGRRLYSLQDLSDADVAKVMVNLRQQETGGSSEFLKLHLHRIVAISVAFRTFGDGGQFKITTLEKPDAPEKVLIHRFFAGISKYAPVLVSWNGGRFDLPVLHYRALRHGVVCSQYWETGEHNSSFRYNNYLNRFHERHTDLMDVLAGYQAGAGVALDDLALLLGLPGKMGMKGDKVWDYFQRGEIQAIRNYCETDVLNTYLVYLRYLLISGRYTPEFYQQECALVRQSLQTEAAIKPHFQEFLAAWIDDSLS